MTSTVMLPSEPIQSHDGPQMVRGVAYIVSVYWTKLSHLIMIGTNPENGFKGGTQFELPEAERGCWSSLPVYDGYQWVRTPHEDHEPTMTQVYEPAGRTAESLVRYWRTNAMSEQGPGIALLPQGVALPSPSGKIDSATGKFKTFIDGLVATQQAFANSCITYASDEFAATRLGNVNNFHRKAATWLYGEGAAQLPWFQQGVFQALKRCPNCGEEILTEARGCKHCSINLAEFYLRMGIQVDEKVDPIVYNDILRMSAKKSVDQPQANSTAKPPTIKF